ncbi:ATP-binding protein [Streptacidiphilus sp. P02-A3a]|uniref:sensor histidine kinase n=1 Tax=Streptacidiphilus sp. P02-A3a TaxID=2704468 RepID=UPI0015F9FC3C|nr:ATP-binding protein [Streptacidiphilus sp. P02-A3a]QMU71484.1 histidine kinase [Streptacidiphilus sp. P02-A3a]
MSALQPAPARVGRRMLPVYAACALALAACVVWMALGFTDLGGPRLAVVDFVPFGSRMLFSLGCAVCGAFIVAHPSGGPVGGMLVVVGTGDLVGQAGPPAAAAFGAGYGVRLAVVGAAVLGSMLYTFLFYAFPLWLPTGRLPDGRWARVLVVLIALWSVAEAYDENAGSESWYGMPSPFTGAPWSGPYAAIDAVVAPVVNYVPLGITVLTFTVMLVRWQRGQQGWLPPSRPYAAPGESPQRTGWLGRIRGPMLLLTPFLLWKMVVSLQYVQITVAPTPLLVLYYVAVLLWPVGLGLVFIPDRSGHLDRASRRTLAVLVVLTGLVVAYLALSLLIFRLVPGSRTPGALVMVVVSLLIGLLMRTTGSRAVRLVDRSYYGERAQPYRVVRELAERLSHAVSPADAPRLLCETVVDTLRFPAARVLLSTSGGPREAAALGEAPSGPWHRFELSYEGTSIGLLEAASRGRESALDQQDHDVLRFLADQAAPAVASLRLYEDLQASRERIVLAREETRRRLRRDLHDGLAPALAGLRLQVDTVCAALPQDQAVGRRLGSVSQGIADAITELRRITDGLAPGILDRGGLDGSLRQLAGQLTGSRLEIEALCEPDPLPPLPAAVEVAVYRIAAEALHNVVRHAGARHARLRVRVDQGAVTAEISDDGRGMDDRNGGPSGSPGSAGGGVGLHSMAERAAELGGTLTLLGNPLADGRGLLVRAVIPVHDPE